MNGKKYNISRKRIKMRDLLDMTDGDPRAQMRVMASCMVDARTGEYMDRDAAMNLLLDLDAEANDVEVAEFSKALEEAQQAAVPLASGAK